MLYPFFKRCLDLFVSLILFLILLPLLTVVSIALLLTGEHEVFYFQKRIGYKQQFFHIWKFATMLKDSPNIGAGTITVRNDPRVTKVGQILRRTKINELPQIINVIKGDMSLVGPRPLVDKTFSTFPEHLRPYVYESKPGITGIGSIIFHDEEKWISNSDMDPHDFYKEHIGPLKAELEYWYFQNRSFWVDLKIIVFTAVAILFPDTNLVERSFKNLPERLQALRDVT